jgi:hypothetical protein
MVYKSNEAIFVISLKLTRCHPPSPFPDHDCFALAFAFFHRHRCHLFRGSSAGNGDRSSARSVVAADAWLSVRVAETPWSSI